MNKTLFSIGLLISLALLIFLFNVFYQPYLDIYFALLGTFAFFSLLLPCLFWFFDSNRIPWWHPIHIFCILMFYSYIGRFLSRYLFLNEDKGINIDYLDNKSLVMNMFSNILLAGISYYLGFMLIKQITNKKHIISIFSKSVKNIDFMIFLKRKQTVITKILLLSIFLGLFIRILTISLGLYTGFTEVENIDLLSSNFMTPLFILDEYTRLAYGLSCVVGINGVIKKSPRSWTFYIAIFYILEEILFLLFFRASKTYLLLYTFFPIFYIVVNQPKKHFMRTIGISIIGFLLFYRILTFTFDYIFAYRFNFVKMAGNTFQISDVVFAVAQQSFDDVIQEKYKESNLTKGANIEDRFAAPDILIVIQEKMPNPVGFIYFQDFWSAPLAWIPRFILPFKPAPITGQVMSYDIWNANGVGITPFPIGEAYMQAGEIGIAITMFLRSMFQMLVLHLCFQYLIIDEVIFASLMILIRTVYSIDSLFISNIAGIIQLIIIFIPVILIINKFKNATLRDFIR